MLTSSPRIVPAIKAMLFFEIYERSEIEQAQAFLAPQYDVIECGASIGANTMQIMMRVAGKVVAVEADAELARILSNNLEENFGPSHKCAIVNAAVDYSGAEAIEFSPGSDSLRGRVDSGQNNLAHPKVRVPAVSLESLIQRYGLGDFVLVLDVEGAEAGIFLHGFEALKKCYRIVCELDGGVSDGKWYSSSDLVSYLASIGFVRIYAHGNRMVFQNSRFS